MGNIEKKSEYLISVDLGFHNTKAYTVINNKEVKVNFESKIGKADRFLFDTDTVRHNNIEHTVGVGQYNIEDKKYKRLNKIFLFNAIGKMFSDTYSEHGGDLTFVVATGNPLVDLVDSDEMEKSILGKYRFEYNGKEFNVNIERVVVIGEAYAAKYLLDAESKTPEKYSIIDIGGGTINVLSTMNGKVNNYQTLPFGILKVYNRIYEAMGDKRGVKGIEDIYTYMDSLDLNDLFEAEKEKFIEEMDENIKIFLFDTIYTCGGGVEFLSSNDKNIFTKISGTNNKKFNIMDDALFVNCRGFYEMTKDLLEVENEQE